ISAHARFSGRPNPAKNYQPIDSIGKSPIPIQKLARKMRMRVIILSHLYKLHINIQLNLSTNCYLKALLRHSCKFEHLPRQRYGKTRIED
ncbi:MULTISPECIES: hypothetical protein, partial [unclassified Halomonas]|uniref:hypothetical protein n=1 Tax=unclassified Halomonas TaxID=2609666 RepID=UPI00403410FE